MHVKIWGARGSCPAPLTRNEYRERLLYVLKFALQLWEQRKCSAQEVLSALPVEYATLIGGETTCLEVCHDGSHLIIDMGSGIRRLGMELTKSVSRGEESLQKWNEIHFLVTHTHWDHIQGWPFFLPAYRAGSKIHFHSCIDNLEERLSGQQSAQNSLLSFEEMGQQAFFHYYPPGENIHLPPFEISTKQLIHPGESTAFKISAAGKTFISASDTEFTAPDLKQQIEQYASFFMGADMLLIDGQYSIEEAKSRKGWGHTSVPVAIECAREWQVKSLILTHHEPSRADQATWKIFQEATEQFQKENRAQKLKIFLACEGDLFDLNTID